MRRAYHLRDCNRVPLFVQCREIHHTPTPSPGISVVGWAGIFSSVRGTIIRVGESIATDSCIRPSVIVFTRTRTQRRIVLARFTRHADELLRRVRGSEELARTVRLNTGAEHSTLLRTHFVPLSYILKSDVTYCCTILYGDASY